MELNNRLNDLTRRLLKHSVLKELDVRGRVKSVSVDDSENKLKLEHILNGGDEVDLDKEFLRISRSINHAICSHVFGNHANKLVPSVLIRNSDESILEALKRGFDECNAKGGSPDYIMIPQSASKMLESTVLELYGCRVIEGSFDNAAIIDLDTWDVELSEVKGSKDGDKMELELSVKFCCVNPDKNMIVDLNVEGDENE